MKKTIALITLALALTLITLAVAAIAVTPTVSYAEESSTQLKTVVTRKGNDRTVKITKRKGSGSWYEVTTFRTKLASVTGSRAQKALANAYNGLARKVARYGWGLTFKVKSGKYHITTTLRYKKGGKWYIRSFPTLFMTATATGKVTCQWKGYTGKVSTNAARQSIVKGSVFGDLGPKI